MTPAEKKVIDAARKVLSDGMLGAHTSHWDETGGSGSGCPACKANLTVAANLRDAMGELDAQPAEPAPTLNDELWKRIAEYAVSRGDDFDRALMELRAAFLWIRDKGVHT